MLRRFLLILIRRSLLILLLVLSRLCCPVRAPDIARKIEHQVRAFYTIPVDVKVTVGAITPSNDMPGYDAVSVKIEGDGQQKRLQVFDFQGPQHHAAGDKINLNKDPFADVMSKIDVTGTTYARGPSLPRWSR